MTGYNYNGEDFFEQSLSGFLITDANGIIVKSNGRLAGWLGIKAAELKGRPVNDLLGIGSKIYYETHLSPLLKMQGFFEEVVVDLLLSSGQKLMVLASALECKNESGETITVNYTLSKATDRLQYERNLQQAKAALDNDLLAAMETVMVREQLIAVLGHDLRNPLGAIGMATQLLETSLLTEEDRQLLLILKRSTYRMTELINNIMDFARTRLGGGIVIEMKHIELQPVLEQVISELKLVFPDKELVCEFDIKEPVYCDADRIGQLLSNLLANAYTHGIAGTAITIRAIHTNNLLKIEVCNSGNKIPGELHERLFAPFTREGSRPSQNGLGLGLYISSEIARAHNGTLTCSSTDEETCFTFEMKA